MTDRLTHWRGLANSGKGPKSDKLTHAIADTLHDACDKIAELEKEALVQRERAMNAERREQDLVRSDALQANELSRLRPGVLAAKLALINIQIEACTFRVDPPTTKEMLYEKFARIDTLADEAIRRLDGGD